MKLNSGWTGTGIQAKITSAIVVFLGKDKYYKAILNWKR
jgi:hypothetical protein